MFVVGSDATAELCIVRDSVDDGIGHAGRGITIQNGLSATNRSSFIMTSSVVEHNQEAALFLGDSDVEVHTSALTGTTPAPDGSFGDGIVALSLAAGRATMLIDKSRVDGNARAGIANFGGDARLGATLLSCNAFDLEGEQVEGQSFSFERVDTNLCGCDHLGDCQVLSDGIAPPAPLEPVSSP